MATLRGEKSLLILMVLCIVGGRGSVTRSLQWKVETTQPFRGDDDVYSIIGFSRIGTSIGDRRSASAGIPAEILGRHADCR